MVVELSGGCSSTLVACSGGIDSMALLYMYAELKEEKGIKVGACYVNHKIRPESESELKFVDKICQGLGIEFYGAQFDDNFWDGSRSNFEERARIERYRIIEKIAVENGFDYVATGHHLDDQAETLLMRIFDRGTGIKGLCGVKPVQRLGRVTMIRPILHLSKKDIIEYMDGKEYIKDPSNKDTTIKRNHFREIVIPALTEALGSEIYKKHISTLSKNAQRETEFTETMAKQFWEELNNSPNPLRRGKRSTGAFPLSASVKKRGIRDALPPLFVKERAGGELFCEEFHIPRKTIEKYSNNFWLTALSYLFSRYRNFSHSTETLTDIVKFMKKKEPATAEYTPFIFERERDGVKIRKMMMSGRENEKM